MDRQRSVETVRPRSLTTAGDRQTTVSHQAGKSLDPFGRSRAHTFGHDIPGYDENDHNVRGTLALGAACWHPEWRQQDAVAARSAAVSRCPIRWNLESGGTSMRWSRPTAARRTRC